MLLRFWLYHSRGGYLSTGSHCSDASNLVKLDINSSPADQETAPEKGLAFNAETPELRHDMMTWATPLVSNYEWH